MLKPFRCLLFETWHLSPGLEPGRRNINCKRMPPSISAIFKIQTKIFGPGPQASAPLSVGNRANKVHRSSSKILITHRKSQTDLKTGVEKSGHLLHYLKISLGIYLRGCIYSKHFIFEFSIS